MDEEETHSVSKGVFVFKTHFKRNKKASKKPAIKTINDLFSNNLWYQEFVDLWTFLNEQYEVLTSETFASMTFDLLEFVSKSYRNEVNEIPTAALLTGINMPDHDAQFRSLENQVRADISPHVASLRSEDCANLKYLIENMISQFIDNDNASELDGCHREKGGLKKSALTMPLLQSWYEHNSEISEKKLLVVVIPDFESFNVKVLQRFILIMSSHLEKLPFVLIFGIATSGAALHTSFPYHVTSKINVKLFKCEPSVVLLNNVLESVFLSPFCPFQLGGKVFNLFTEIFLFYDFSVRTFVQNIKFAMMEHFYYGNAMALCQIEKKVVRDLLDIFSHEDCENVRQFLSFRKLVELESYENRIRLLTDDKYFKQVVFEKVVLIQKYIKRLHIFLKCLHVLVADLPGSPLGKNLREVYAVAVTIPITQSIEYKESFKLLNFQSRDELKAKLEKISDILRAYINEGSKKTQLKDFYNEIDKCILALEDIDNLSDENEEFEEMECENLNSTLDRKALKQALLSRVKQKPKPLNKYEKFREEILAFMSRHFEIYLVHPYSLHLHEIFFYDDISIKGKIIGMHRSAIHNALNNPQYYMQCNCCAIANTRSIRATMPDICIAYKLHLEYGKMINLYDWLQAYLCIVDPKSDDALDVKSKKVVDPELQARFTQAVAELEYLGYVKTSKRKADHVARLTWEG